MTGRELFKAWQLPDINYWANFTKPALFATAKDYDFTARHFEPLEPPTNIKPYCNRETAFIVDLCGELGVTAGLGLAQMGFMPVPLYTVINERNIGGLTLAIDNSEILEALHDGVGILSNCQYDLSEDSAPAFLLDYRRLQELPNHVGVFDNRWNITDLDLPTAETLLARGIKKVVLWTAGAANGDVVSVLRAYNAAGIAIVQYVNEELLTGDLGMLEVEEDVTAEEREMYGKDVIKFEMARFSMWFLVFFGVTNLITQMLLWEEPWMWSVPSFQWLIYLWVPEGSGDFFSFAFAALYFVAWKTMRKNRIAIVPILWMLVADSLALYIYAFYYDISDWMYGIGWIALALPLITILLVSRAVDARKNLEGLDLVKYMAIRDSMLEYQPNLRWLVLFRSPPNEFSGYDGYGGSGRGGYRSRGGYRGYSSFGG